MRCFVKLEIHDFLKDGATEVWNQAQDVPCAYKENQWVGYDNIKRFQLKVTELHRILVLPFDRPICWLMLITSQLKMFRNIQNLPRSSY